MIPAAFDYVRAASVEDALRLLDAGGDDAKVLAGGQSLIPMMKLRFVAPAMLVDIRTIPALRAIEVDAQRVTIGALTTHAAIAESEQLQRAAPVLWEAANVLGDPQIRNLGTIGGSAAHADPAADYPAALLALDAEFTLVSHAGERRVSAGSFFTGMFETVLAPGELLTAVHFAPAPFSAYVKFHHPASHYAVVGVAATLSIAGGAIAAARIALTGLDDCAFRAPAAERALIGVRPDDASAVAAACSGVAAGRDARGDTFASAAYRIAVADVFAARAVMHAARR